MLVIPAIDLKGGRCVRLRQGRMEEETVFSDDPLAVAERWVAAGARRLHIVDLDGAASGRPVHADVVARICAAFPDLPVQVGGGIRDEETIQAYLDAGVSYVILGTRAVTAPHFVSDACLEFPGHILVGLDVRDGRVALDGWSKLARHSVVELAQRLEAEGAEGIVYTDITRDGMLSGINVEATAALARELAIPVIAAGGIRDLDDIRALCAVADEGILGAITGRALYEGTLDLAEGQRLADELTGTAA
ncbi:1-(5-phosphoribosyl)-5-[(5-phosphoribosylamino)methylideneamino]imidazole-4-carboxamide isomerase [Inmirania thermothiophila]|uniref:1-(5-phosphoribosyl)-5-[(5-phosphoribosylamino)methylideneamino] imidazole-4-carboxamide isomerase n=1 Tax=Inmirania thermothiophila TaxID=1750597 RepID=A0A3N1Y6L3_9GAMM|nr:1-(5-phosphoribosyl)-5-[(5-phosphoribosylamino)methylideneamino]imidazole-4-carboxamide isomerase [Inmirania thermothiophila]ROR34466.1 1-(5-phosphoribosyl)-5-[(5-phosphoribosylamino)methylideneamino] imidazole-4-carboxamide isomerase [Inmirania thermothiophila]